MISRAAREALLSTQSPGTVKGPDPAERRCPLAAAGKSPGGGVPQNRDRAQSLCMQRAPSTVSCIRTLENFMTLCPEVVGPIWGPQLLQTPALKDEGSPHASAKAVTGPLGPQSGFLRGATPRF